MDGWRGEEALLTWGLSRCEALERGERSTSHDLSPQICKAPALTPQNTSAHCHFSLFCPMFVANYIYKYATSKPGVTSISIRLFLFRSRYVAFALWSSFVLEMCHSVSAGEMFMSRVHLLPPLDGSCCLARELRSPFLPTRHKSVTVETKTRRFSHIQRTFASVCLFLLQFVLKLSLLLLHLYTCVKG